MEDQRSGGSGGAGIQRDGGPCTASEELAVAPLQSCRRKVKGMTPSGCGSLLHISVADLLPSVLSHFGQLRKQKHKVGERQNRNERNPDPRFIKYSVLSLMLFFKYGIYY